MQRGALALDLFKDPDKPVVERKRDRLWRRPQSLSEGELLELVLGPGPSPRTRDGKKSSSAAAFALSKHVGNVAEISRATPRELAPLVGRTRAARVAAAFELGRRAVQLTFHRESVGRPEDIYRLAAPRMVGLAQEIFLVVGVDVRNGLLDVMEIARGTVIGVEVHPREIFRPLIRMNAAGGVLVHNHPSGDPTPSPEDIQLTRRMREIGHLMGTPIIDHVVVAQHGYRSICEYMGPDFDAPPD
jgi:DNA repair protein RadC